MKVIQTLLCGISSNRKYTLITRSFGSYEKARNGNTKHSWFPISALLGAAVGLSVLSLEKKNCASCDQKRDRKEVSPSTKNKKASKVQYDKPEVELLKRKRAIFLTGRIDDSVAHDVMLKLLLLDSVSEGSNSKNEKETSKRTPAEKPPILMYINSGGGKISSGLAIYDAMQAVESPVHTYVLGRACSMASILAAAGEPGHRIAYENARFMVHEASTFISKQKVTEVKVRFNETLYRNSVLIELLSKHTGKSIESIQKTFDRDHWMSADQAVEFGLIDTVIRTKPS